MKKMILFLVFCLSHPAYAQPQEVDSIKIDKYFLFEKKSDSLINEINNFYPMSGDTEYDLYIVNDVLPKTLEYILLMKDVIRKAKEKKIDIDFKFIIDGLIENLEEYKDILK